MTLKLDVRTISNDKCLYRDLMGKVTGRTLESYSLVKLSKILCINTETKTIKRILIFIFKERSLEMQKLLVCELFRYSNNNNENNNKNNSKNNNYNNINNKNNNDNNTIIIVIISKFQPS